MEPDAASPPPTPRAGKSGTLAALPIVLLLPAGLAAQAADPLAGLLWTELFVFLLPAAVATAGANLEPRAWLRLRAPSARAAALGLLAGGAAWLLGSALYAATRALAPRPLVERFDLSRLFEGPPAQQTALVLVAVIAAPLCEELAFRGHLARAWQSRHRPWIAIAASAALFALLHLDPLRAPALLVLGLVYGWLARRSGSLWPAVLAHAANNALAAALAFGAGDAAEEPTLGAALVGVGAGAALLAVVVALHRALPPPPPEPLPLLDPCASAAFRLRRVPTPLVVVAAAGWVALGAILRSAR